MLIRNILSRNMTTIPICTVKRLEKSDRVQISLEHLHIIDQPSNTTKANDNTNIKRIYNLDRLKSEEVGRTIARLSTNIGKPLHKKLKKKDKNAAFPEINIKLFRNGVEVNDSDSNEHAWFSADELQIGNIKYKIEVNLPEVKSLKIPTYFMPGYATFPKIELEFSNYDDCIVDWYRELSLTEQNHTNIEKSLLPANYNKLHCTKIVTPESVHIHTGQSYIPVKDDIGCFLKVRCTPAKDGRRGKAVEIVSTSTVASCPKPSPLEKRYLETQNQCSRDRLV